MQKAILLILVLVVLMSCRSVKNHNEQVTKLHDVAHLHEDIDRIYVQLKRHHPKLYQYTPKEVLDFKFDSLKKIITTPIDSREFYKKLAPVVSQVKQGHISLSSANKWYTKKARKQLLKNKFEFYALDFEYLENKLWIKDTRGKDSTIIGCEIVKIEDDFISDLIDVYKTRFSSDGYNTTLHNRYVGQHFSNFYYKDKGVVDSLRVTFKNKDSLFVKTFRRLQKKEKPKKQDTTKTAKRIKLTSAEKKANRLASKKRRKFNKKHGFIKKYKTYTRNFRFMEEVKDVAYMKLRSFTNGNYKRFYKQSFTKLDSAKTKHLILDLRDNGGGRIAEIDYLYSYLTNKAYKFIEDSEVNSRVPFLKFLMSNTTPNSIKVLSGMMSPIIVVQNLIRTRKRDGKLYYRFRQTKVKEPKPLHFTGKIYVLINGNSFSASSLISTHLKATKRALFVGEETGGAYNGTVAGIYKVYELPNTKLKIRMGMMQVEAPQKQNPDGYGVKPDVEILPTISDRELKKDTELDWVLKDIKNKG
ncbi:S41 family peptidase [Flavivirga spongiicola]|uniref:S41 family peptidase n=1 Tax=Flavivirga spongiicola TaxID=421621 RepID=A0ABU7XZW7_9FLAO|nr:S41 family peptidase [Flavivirga sp. MEBiC05379]MDO5981000.1 S41 family peptidase [Flavivirga sp. MEBiC05379]